MARFSKTALRILTSLLALTLALVVSEIGFRGLVASRTPAGMTFGDSLVYDLEPHAEVFGVQLNDGGGIGDDLASLPEKDLVVFLFGGSTSYSAGYVKGVRKNLEHQTQSKVGVVSWGRPRYTSHSNWQMAERWIPRYRPDYVVLYLGINDNIYNAFPGLEGRPEVGFFDWKRFWPPMFVRLAQYHGVQKRWKSKPDFIGETLPSVSIFESNVRRMVELSRREGARVVLSEFAISYPALDETLRIRLNSDDAMMSHFWGHQASAAYGVEAHNRVLLDLHREYETLYAPVSSLLPKDSSHFTDLCHLKPRAIRRLSQSVAGSIGRDLERSRSDSVELGESPLD